MPYESKATRWNLWSQAKQRYFPKSVWFQLCAFCHLFPADRHLLVARGRSRSAVLFLSVMAGMLIISFVTPIPGDGQNDLEKHLFNYNAILDLLLLLYWRGYVASIVMEAP
jgi:hypothetical protein